MSKWRADKVKKLLEEMGEDEKTDMLADLLTAPENVLGSIELSLLSDYTQQAEERHLHFGQMQGIGSGYDKIDQLTKGFVPGELIVIAGKTSHGKTTLALNIANHVALKGKTVLFVTLEMTQVELTSRYMFINDGNTDEYQEVAGHTVLQSANELNWRNIDGLMQKAKEEMDVDLVIIDHLHYFTRELEHVAEDLGRITKELKKNAIIHGVPVILISHVRRTAKNSDEASIDDLRGSSYIAQDADIVLMVSRSRIAPELLTVTISKNRNRGYDYNFDSAELFLDKIKIFNNQP